MKTVVILTAGLALLLGGCMQATLDPVSDANFTARDRKLLANPPYEKATIPLTYQRHVVQYHRKEAPGSILVEAGEKQAKGLLKQDGLIVTITARNERQVLDAARALRPGNLRQRSPRHGQRTDRADRGHGQQGRGRGHQR